MPGFGATMVDRLRAGRARVTILSLLYPLRGTPPGWLRCCISHALSFPPRAPWCPCTLPHTGLGACRTPQETEALLEGVEACGQGSWAAIKRLGKPGLAKRSSVDLKDKWRNLRRAASISSHHR